MNIKRFQFNSGESYSILLGDDLLPMYYPNLFVTLNHRNHSDMSNTCYKEFEHIKLLYEITRALNINFEERCKSGSFLERHEIEKIAKLAKYKNSIFRHADSIFLTMNNKRNLPLLNKKENARFSNEINSQIIVSSKTHYNRLTTFYNYIGWLECFLFPMMKTSANNIFKTLRPKCRERLNIVDNSAVRVISILNGDIASNLSHVSNYNDNYRTLTQKQIAQILEAVHPESNKNPWKRMDVRYRNQLLIHLLYSTGMRRGEAIRLKVSDVGLSTATGRYNLIVRVGEDLEDKRRNKPSAKTSGRRIPLHQTLYRMIEDYIIFHRSKASHAEKIPYIIIPQYPGVITNGYSGLSLVSVNKICHQISLVVGFTVYPHMFRHAWNDRYSELAESLVKSGKSTEAKIESDRRKLMGWSSDSEMGGRYAKKYEDERAINTGLQLQDSSYTEECLNLIVNNISSAKVRGR
ncbi:tyrosine-type recombinase/integrase [Buttiauxella gaviniae]|uniref:tyrosine-type recombinase/integrase n=1 Tax=Buttiauxella gaviniae TaxID=82990 RepID=UPI0039755B59